jgi:hypothetical protein
MSVLKKVLVLVAAALVLAGAVAAGVVLEDGWVRTLAWGVAGGLAGSPVGAGVVLVLSRRARKAQERADQEAAEAEALARAAQEEAPKANHYLGVQGALEEVSEPVRAWKLATLRVAFDDDGMARPALVGLHHGAPYAAVGDAECLAKGGHAGSLVECTCGFHAYFDEEGARAHEQKMFFSMLLEVVGSGEVVRHEKGWRFSHQRVRKVHVRSCGVCLRRPSVVLAARDMTIDKKVHKATMSGRCPEHLGNWLVSDDQPTAVLKGYFTFEEVAALLSAEADAVVEVVSRAQGLTRAELEAALRPAHDAKVLERLRELREGVWAPVSEWRALEAARPGEEQGGAQGADEVLQEEGAARSAGAEQG